MYEYVHVSNFQDTVPLLKIRLYNIYTVPSSLAVAAAAGLSRAEPRGFSEESRGRDGSRAGGCSASDAGTCPTPEAVRSRGTSFASGCIRRGGRATLLCLGGLENVNTVAPPLLPPVPFDAAPAPPPAALRLLRAGVAALARLELLLPLAADEAPPEASDAALFSVRNCCLAAEDAICGGLAVPTEFARRRRLRATKQKKINP